AGLAPSSRGEASRRALLRLRRAGPLRAVADGAAARRADQAMPGQVSLRDPCRRRARLRVARSRYLPQVGGGAGLGADLRDVPPADPALFGLMPTGRS